MGINIRYCVKFVTGIYNIVIRTVNLFLTNYNVYRHNISEIIVIYNWLLFNLQYNKWFSNDRLLFPDRNGIKESKKASDIPISENKRRPLKVNLITKRGLHREKMYRGQRFPVSRMGNIGGARLS
jgi:hypothetical protein